MYNYELEKIRNIKKGDYNILVLGGSAISDVMPAQMGILLGDTLNNKEKPVKYEVCNLAFPGCNSRDMDEVTDFLSDDQLKIFDAVVYYESINDSRFNCIPAESFRDDYSHSHWYQEVRLMNKHPEMNYSIIPFVIDLFKERLEEKSGKRKMLNDDMDVSADLMPFGSRIKTDKSFAHNLQNIVNKFESSSRIFLVEYHAYYPEEFLDKKNLGFHNERKIYKAKGPATTLGAWGYPENVKKAIAIHNQILLKLADAKNEVYYIQTDSLLSTLHNYYFDNCHFTIEAGKVFSNYLADQIIFKSATKEF